MKKAVTVLAAVLMLLVSIPYGYAESESPYQTIPFPRKGAKPENFYLSESGVLMFKTNDGTYAYQNGKWSKSDMRPVSAIYEIVKKGSVISVLQNGELVYTDQEMQTLCITDDTSAYGTKDNKVY